MLYIDIKKINGFNDILIITFIKGCVQKSGFKKNYVS